MMALLLQRDCLVSSFLIYLNTWLKILVNYLNQESPENHPNPKPLPCLLSRLKLVVVGGGKVTEGLDGLRDWQSLAEGIALPNIMKWVRVLPNGGR